MHDCDKHDGAPEEHGFRFNPGGRTMSMEAPGTDPVEMGFACHVRSVCWDSAIPSEREHSSVSPKNTGTREWRERDGTVAIAPGGRLLRPIQPGS